MVISGLICSKSGAMSASERMVMLSDFNGPEHLDDARRDDDAEHHLDPCLILLEETHLHRREDVKASQHPPCRSRVKISRETGGGR